MRCSVSDTANLSVQDPIDEFDPDTHPFVNQIALIDTSIRECNAERARFASDGDVYDGTIGAAGHIESDPFVNFRQREYHGQARQIKLSSGVYFQVPSVYASIVSMPSIYSTMNKSDVPGAAHPGLNPDTRFGVTMNNDGRGSGGNHNNGQGGRTRGRGQFQVRGRGGHVRRGRGRGGHRNFSNRTTQPHQSREGTPHHEAHHFMRPSYEALYAENERLVAAGPVDWHSYELGREVGRNSVAGDSLNSRVDAWRNEARHDEEDDLANHAYTFAQGYEEEESRGSFTLVNSSTRPSSPSASRVPPRSQSANVFR